jgi:hypothetical protein
LLAASWVNVPSGPKNEIKEIRTPPKKNKKKIFKILIFQLVLKYRFV